MCSAVLCTYSAEELFIISRLSRPAGRSKRIFTGGVVKANGSCSAAFCESAALREASSPSQSPSVTALPKGEPLAVHANFISLPRPLPLGEVDLRSKDGEGEDACGGRTLSVIAARCHLPRKGEVLLYLSENGEKLPLRGKTSPGRGKMSRSDKRGNLARRKP